MKQKKTTEEVLEGLSALVEERPKNSLAGYCKIGRSHTSKASKTIPNVIHYCWFGYGELSPLAKKCISSWKKFFPNHEIKEWNESNFDVTEIAYTREAYAAKKYAFVSDYARFKILYEHGGIYFDVDVEVLKPFDEILRCGGFMGLEQDVPEGMDETNCVNPGLGLACAPGLGLYKELINLYRTLRFEISPGVYNFKTVVQYISETLLAKGLRVSSGIMEIEGIRIYPKEYFNPMEYETGKICLTDNTYSIHHYSASWCSLTDRFRIWIRRRFGFCPFVLVVILTQNPLKTARSIVRKFKKG